MKRREFLKAGALALAPLALPRVLPAAVKQRPAKRPNILWIQTDEQRADSLGCYGSAWAKTPHLDALAARGVRFENCYCNAPVCVPSRISQLTGRYPHECGTVHNRGGRVPEGTITFPELFAQNGYQTCNFGKTHVPRDTPWQHDEVIICDWPDIGYFKLGARFDESQYRVIHRKSSTPVIQGGTYPAPLEQHPSHVITDKGIEFLRNHDRSKPFVLRISHNSPHTPVLPPAPYDKLFQGVELPIRYTDFPALAERSGYDRKMAAIQRADLYPVVEYDQAWRDYLGLVSYVDSEVGRLLEALKQSGLEEDTIVLFSADHGRMLGEFGTCEKEVFDKGAWRVPFILSWPGHMGAGEADGGVCSLVDTVPTLLGLTGVEHPQRGTLPGRDLLSTSAPEAVFGEIGFPNSGSEICTTSPFREFLEKEECPWRDTMRVAMRTGKWRMDCDFMRGGKVLPLAEADGNLVDEEKDPMERENLWGRKESAGVKAELHGKMVKWFEGTRKPAELFGDAEGREASAREPQ